MGRVRREFTHFSRAWYSRRIGPGPGLADDVILELWEDTVQVGALHVEWVDLGSRTVVPRLVVFDDGWGALAAMPDVVRLLGEHDDANVSPARFCELLAGLGFSDATPLREP